MGQFVLSTWQVLAGLPGGGDGGDLTSVDIDVMFSGDLTATLIGGLGGVPVGV